MFKSTSLPIEGLVADGYQYAQFYRGFQSESLMECQDKGFQILNVPQIIDLFTANADHPWLSQGFSYTASNVYFRNHRGRPSQIFNHSHNIVPDYSIQAGNRVVSKKTLSEIKKNPESYELAGYLFQLDLTTRLFVQESNAKYLLGFDQPRLDKLLTQVDKIHFSSTLHSVKEGSRNTLFVWLENNPNYRALHVHGSSQGDGRVIGRKPIGDKK